MADKLEFLENSTSTRPLGTVIWLHGLGADATDFEPLVPMLDLSVDLKFIFPNAPERSITINGGAKMRGWYDIDSSGTDGKLSDIIESTDSISSLIEEEISKGTPAEKITLAGFSQGGVIALQTGLSHDQTLKGIMALSTYLYDPESLVDRIGFANIDTPIFMAHGISDPMIPITKAITSRETLLKHNYQVEWHEYAMGHQVCPQQVSEIGRWLNNLYLY